MNHPYQAVFLLSGARPVGRRCSHVQPRLIFVRYPFGLYIGYATFPRMYIPGASDILIGLTNVLDITLSPRTVSTYNVPAIILTYTKLCQIYRVHYRSYIPGKATKSCSAKIGRASCR